MSSVGLYSQERMENSMKFQTKTIKAAVSSLLRNVKGAELYLKGYSSNAILTMANKSVIGAIKVEAIEISPNEEFGLNGKFLHGFNAARSIVCVETLCPAALVPRGLRRHFGKTRFFAPFLASADELCPEKWESHRRCPLCGAGCTVLERRNGGMRLCARAGALSISFSSYLMIAHASFFFNDVFASMQRGR